MAYYWAVSGWLLFITENVVLSENRSTIIALLEDDKEESKYHMLYGTCSTIATGTILYGYRKIASAPPFRFSAIPKGHKITAWAFHSLALMSLSQLFPKLQIPVMNSKVRCPFDLTPCEPGQLRGIERVSRHAALWSMACFGVGQAIITPSIPLAVWYTMPTLVALVGGAHHDYRFQRGIGGSVSPEMTAKTSNIPFMGLLFGDQREFGGALGAFKQLGSEIKWLNCAGGVLGASVWALRYVKK